MLPSKKLLMIILIPALQEHEPEKPFKGSLNIRIGRELYEKAALIAKEIGW
jgi:predicted HicB family RNase H-like nuclease